MAVQCPVHFADKCGGTECKGKMQVCNFVNEPAILDNYCKNANSHTSPPCDMVAPIRLRYILYRTMSQVDKKMHYISNDFACSVSER